MVYMELKKKKHSKTTFYFNFLSEFYLLYLHISENWIERINTQRIHINANNSLDLGRFKRKIIGMLELLLTVTSSTSFIKSKFLFWVENYSCSKSENKCCVCFQLILAEKIKIEREGKWNFLKLKFNNKTATCVCEFRFFLALFLSSGFDALINFKKECSKEESKHGFFFPSLHFLFYLRILNRGGDAISMQCIFESLQFK
jgi:hypothetical protein